MIIFSLLNLYKVNAENVSDIMSKMTLEQKVGQMMFMGYEGRMMNNAMYEMIINYSIGGFFLLPLSNFNLPDECATLANELQKTALSSRLKIPLFIAIDQEGGVAAPIHYMQGATPTPGNMALGASGREIDTYNAYYALGNDMKVCGVNVNFAPAIDILTEPKNPDYTIRSFGNNMSKTHRLARGAVKGLKDSGVIACAKHFPGLAYFTEDSHQTLPQVALSDAELMAGELSHFRGAIEGGVDMIMTVHCIFSDWDHEYPVTLSSFILKKILRKKLNYRGLIITDSMGMGAIAKNYSIEEATVKAVQAGCDIILQVSNKPAEVQRRINAVINAVHTGQINEKRINDSVKRILTIKEKYGLFDNPYANPDEVYEYMSTKKIIAANNNAAVNGVVVLRDKNKILPLEEKYDSILVISPPSIITRAGKDEYLPIGYTLGDILMKEFPHVKSLLVDTVPNDFEIQLAVQEAPFADLIIAYLLLTEFSPKQKELINNLLKLNKPTILIGMGMPSDARFFPEASTIVLTHSPAPISVAAGIDVILGKAKAGGSLPFPVNGQLFKIE
ncbi:MAG TPA: glycoside hydrolase family 3 N-terminal domain-containing protein [Candidatus Marinimicrobia bacterium]|jgi:beta-N-acetylhexosaminidase|nr:glycoside hydrolase family 3 N-terminal domain-containing protein [Candidatus Neomarinimicrobiota bacterium]HJM70660.1 glycoside hydrolase family 3 N-terminal domain-containing protein [Candidatus Neomarinimicrobiota bacterium]|tara:strand:+ start:1125 stop:2804 length:1680 start_codon:yes stop_codon:yes gene_type:complete